VALSRATLERAALLVDRSGLATELEAVLTSTGPDGTPERRGRPRRLSVRTLLIGIALTALDNRELHLVRAQHILNNLTWKQCQSLGLTQADTAGLKTLTARQVSYLWCRIVEVFDPSPHFSPDAATALNAWRPDEPTQDDDKTEDKPLFDPERLDLLQGVLDRIIEASLLDSDIPGRHTGAYAVDWTYVESWARRRRSRSASPDPDAAHIYIENKAKTGPKYRLYGYKLHAVIRTRAEGGDRVPYLAERITLTPASANPQTQVLEVVKDLAAEDRIEMLIADRGYTFSKSERWADPLREMGIDTVFDLHPNQRSTQGTYKGAVQLDGQMYCPALPEALFDIERLDQFATQKEREKFFAEIERRQTYEMKPHGKEKSGKPRRVKCPAAAGVARCALKPDSLNLPYDYPTIYPDQALRSSPPPCCSQDTVSVQVEIQSNTRQSRAWGSREWFDVYARLRPAVESFFSLIKDPGKEHMSRGRIKMMGLAKTSVMVAFWTAAANLRLLDAFDREEARRASGGGLTVTSLRKPRRHRAVSLSVRPPSSTDPPKAPATATV
jgi:hypothetical protein